MTQPNPAISQVPSGISHHGGDDSTRPKLTKEELLERMLRKIRDDAELRRSQRMAEQRGSITSSDKPVIERKTNVSVGSITQSFGSVGTYKVKGSEYYRYSYRQGGKVKHVHLGPVKDPATKLKAQRIRLAISERIEPPKIIAWYCKK